jgi:hypothetical protein
MASLNEYSRRERARHVGLMERGLLSFEKINYFGFALPKRPKMHSTVVFITYSIAPAVWAWSKERMDDQQRFDQLG